MKDFSVSSSRFLLHSLYTPFHRFNCSISNTLFPFTSDRNSLQLFSGQLHHISTRPARSFSMDPCSPTLLGTPTKKSEAAKAFENSGAFTSSKMDRIGEVKRVTKETDVFVKVNLDGCGLSENSTGIPFLDHMLDQLASHGLFDVHVEATGDYHIDDHHTNEDVGLALGTALLQALGDRRGIRRFGDFFAHLDEALIHVTLDLSGRPHLSCDLEIPTQRVGTYDTQLAGKNSHHIIEATFKAFARALRQAIECDLRRQGSVPSSKGVLSRA